MRQNRHCLRHRYLAGIDDLLASYIVNIVLFSTGGSDGELFLTTPSFHLSYFLTTRFYCNRV